MAVARFGSGLARFCSLPSASSLAALGLTLLAGSLAAQHQFEDLRYRALPVVDDLTASIALGDVDGDGDLDLVVGNIYAQDRLYLNAGDGTFVDVTATAMPPDVADTRDVAFADVDGDGDLDLVLASGQSTQNRLYLNNGAGVFTDVTSTHMPVDTSATFALAIGDVDGDGDLDIVCATAIIWPQQNRLYLNNGAGVFSDVTVSNLPPQTDDSFDVVLGDVDGDGDLDIVFANTSQDRLYLNAGNGTFTDATAQRLPVDNSSAIGIALADVDNDGDLDLFVLNLGQNSLYRNLGNGTFVDDTAASLPPDNDNEHAVALVDIDGDGDRDLVIACFGAEQVLLNDGVGVFVAGTPGQIPVQPDITLALAMGDVDADGDLDLVLGNYFTFGAQNRLCLNDGTGHFVDANAPRLPNAMDTTLAVALGDVDGDHDLDLVCGNQSNYTPHERLYLNDGSGVFAEAALGQMPPDPITKWALVLADVDQDGDLDLVSGSWGQNSLYLNDGTGTFTEVTATRMPIDSDLTVALLVADVDGDGDLDIVCGNWDQPGGSSQSRLYRNGGTGTFTDVTATQMPIGNYSTTCLALGDVDGDGDLDLVCGNGAQQNRLYLNSGLGVFTDATFGHMPVDLDVTTGVALGDVDGDGDLDLVIANNGQNRLYRNDGTGTFTDVTATRMPIGVAHSTCVAMRDIDGDGDLDLVFGGYGCTYSPCMPLVDRVYVNDGTGTFTDASATLLPLDGENTQCLAFGDVDGDGDADLVLGKQESCRLYTNLFRQLATPTMLRVGRTATLDVYSRHGLASATELALACLSTARLSLPLPPLGTLGVDPQVLLPLMLIPQPAGVGSTTWAVPNAPAFIGSAIYAQALLSTSPTQLALTNVTADPLGH